jgi:hypothetical protein
VSVDSCPQRGFAKIGVGNDDPDRAHVDGQDTFDQSIDNVIAHAIAHDFPGGIDIQLILGRFV